LWRARCRNLAIAVSSSSLNRPGRQREASKAPKSADSSPR
jgi:hypothetical protein